MSSCDVLYDPLIVLQARYKDSLHPALVDPLLALAAVELRQSDTASWQRYLPLPSRQSTIYQTASNTYLSRQSGVLPASFHVFTKHGTAPKDQLCTVLSSSVYVVLFRHLLDTAADHADVCRCTLLRPSTFRVSCVCSSVAICKV